MENSAITLDWKIKDSTSSEKAVEAYNQAVSSEITAPQAPAQYNVAQNNVAKSNAASFAKQIDIAQQSSDPPDSSLTASPPTQVTSNPQYIEPSAQTAPIYPSTPAPTSQVIPQNPLVSPNAENSKDTASKERSSSGGRSKSGAPSLQKGEFQQDMGQTGSKLGNNQPDKAQPEFGRSNKSQFNLGQTNIGKASKDLAKSANQPQTDSLILARTSRLTEKKLFRGATNHTDFSCASRCRPDIAENGKEGGRERGMPRKYQVQKGMGLSAPTSINSPSFLDGAGFRINEIADMKNGGGGEASGPTNAGTQAGGGAAGTTTTAGAAGAAIGGKGGLAKK